MLRAFRQLGLCPRDYSLIAFKWERLLYFDLLVPMGLRSASYCCQMTTNSLVYIHSLFNFWSLNYLDDFASCELESKIWDSYNCMTWVLQVLQVAEATDKAIEPTTRMEFLGNLVDTVKLTLEVAPERVAELLQLINIWLEKKTFRKKHMQSLIGKLSFVTNCIKAGRIFISRLIEAMAKCLEEGTLPIENETKLDLIWWKNYLPRFNGVSILWLQDQLQIDFFLAMDASLIGGVAVQGKDFFHFKYSQEILFETTNIAQRELFTILIAVKIWKQQLAGKVVRLSMDSQVAMYAINKGRSKDKFTLKCLRELI